jgi:hypothetical protein
MTENPNSYQILPEIASMQDWITQEVIDKGTCPPLVKLARVYKGEGGEIDWASMAKEVEITSYRQYTNSSEILLGRVVTDYLQYISHMAKGTAPLTKVFVLPDFVSNPDYDAFMDDVKRTALETLLSTPEGVEISREAFQKIAQLRNLPKDQVGALLNGGKVEQTVIGINVVEGVANPVYFYGNRLTDRDIADFSDTRGPRDRQRMLSRAPYYAFQVVNTLRSPEISANLNRPGLHARNTRLALKTDLNQYEGVMRRLRK